MNTEIKEQLSALMDGEVQRDAARFVLRAVETDRTLAADWSRFHIARDCLQRRQVLVADAGFAAAVMARIDLETAPAQAGTSRWVRYLSGGAVAAAVAVVALMASAPTHPPARSPIRRRTVSFRHLRAAPIHPTLWACSTNRKEVIRCRVISFPGAWPQRIALAGSSLSSDA